MTIDLRAVLRNEYDLQDAGFFPNALRYQDETPRHNFASVIGPLTGGKPFILLTARDSFNEGLCRALFLFLDSNSSCLTVDREVSIVEGFKHEGYIFDSVLVLNSLCHNMYSHISEELNKDTLAAFPVMRCEFTGNETADEIDDIRHDGPCTIDWNREPSPYVMMRFRNQKTGASTLGNDLWYAKASYVEYEILELTEEPKSFIELRNYLGEQVRIVKTGEHYEIDLGDGAHSVERSYIKHWLKEFLKKGLKNT